MEADRGRCTSYTNRPAPWYSQAFVRLRMHAVRWAVCRVVVFFLLALIALDFLVAAHSRVWREYDPDPYIERLEACRRQPWDMVVVGGSPVMYGVNPSVLSGVSYHGQALDRVYTLGLPLATASEIDLAVEHDLPGALLRLLVYGVSATDYNEDRVEPYGPRRLMTCGDLLRWSWDRPEAAGWAGRHYVQQHTESMWNLYSYRYGIRLWAADEVEWLCPGVCPEAAATAHGLWKPAAALRPITGFRRSPSLPKVGSTASRPPASRSHFSLHGPLSHRRLLANLHRIMDRAAHRRIPLLLVDMPVSADLEDRMYSREYAAYRAALAAAAQSHGVRVLYATARSGRPDGGGLRRCCSPQRRRRRPPERLAAASARTDVRGGPSHEFRHARLLSLSADCVDCLPCTTSALSQVSFPVRRQLVLLRLLESFFPLGVAGADHRRLLVRPSHRVGPDPPPAPRLAVPEHSRQPRLSGRFQVHRFLHGQQPVPVSLVSAGRPPIGPFRMSPAVGDQLSHFSGH